MLKEGMRIFYATGFHGTSVDMVLTAAGAPKGSFYHHFGSKDEFALAIIDRYSSQQLGDIQKYASRDDLNGYQQIAGYFEFLFTRIVRARYKVACLAGKFSSELGPLSDSFSTALSATFAEWRSAIIELVANGQDDGSIRTDISCEKQAFLLQSLMQGSLVMALADRSDEGLSTIVGMLPALLGPPSMDSTLQKS